MRNDKRRFLWAIVESLRLGVRDFGCGGLWSDKAFRVAGMVLNLGVFGIVVASGRPREAEGPG